LKTISNTVREEFYRQNFIAIDLVELHLSTPLYLCSGGINFSYDSATAPTAGTNSYDAQGNFISFSGMSEDFDVRVGKFTITLSGVGNSYVNKFIDTSTLPTNKTDYEGSRVVVYKAFLNYNNLTIAGTPLMIFDGVIFNVSIQETAKSCTINLECASLFSDFERTAGRKSNNNSNWLYQGSTYDSAMEQSGYVGQSEYKWGRL
jgi:hypothetical protein